MYKFYSLSSYNLEAMNNNYLYAAHPLELNDKFDCFKGFINYDSASEEQVKNFLKNFHSEKEIEERFLE